MSLYLQPAHLHLHSTPRPIDSAEDKSGATLTLSFINRSEQEAYVYWLRKADKPGKLPATFRPSNHFSVGVERLPSLSTEVRPRCAYGGASNLQL